MKHASLILSMIILVGAMSVGAGAEQVFDGGAVNAIAVYDNTVWCATDAGVLQVDSDTLVNRVYAEADGLPATDIQTVSINRRGEPWVGGAWGVSRMLEDEWETLVLPGDQKSTGILEIGLAPQGDIWLCRSVIQYQYNGFVWLSWSLENILRYSQFNDLDIDSDGRIWMATTVGLFSYKDYTWTIHSEEPGAPGSTEFLAVAVGEADVWSATADGLYRYHEGVWTPFGTDGLFGPTVRALAIDGDGIAWAVSSGDDASGVSRFDGSAWHRVIDDSQTGGAMPECIAVGADDTLWLGSAAGLFRFSGISTSVNDDGQLPAGTAIKGNYPNPFNPTTSIAFTVSDQKDIDLSIFSMSGQKVRSLVDGSMDAGQHVVQWDGRADDGQSVASGLYFAALTSGEYRVSHRLMLLR